MKKRLTEKQRHSWSAMVLVVGLSTLPMSLSLLAVTVYIRFVVDEELELVQGMNTAALPYFLASTGTVNFMCNLFLLSIMARAHRPSSRVDAVQPLLVAIFINLAATLLVFCGFIFCFVQMAMLPSSFQAGLKEAMWKYSSVPHIKVRMDLLQMEYRCCGDTGFQDWFEVPWVSQDILVADLKEVQKHLADGAQYTNDDVPFSCCNPASPRPCIHHHVTTNHLHYNYDYHLNTTLYTTGCRQTLMDYFGHRLLQSVGLSLLFLVFAQLGLLAVSRLVQSSMENAIIRGDITASAMGYLFFPPRVSLKTDLEAGAASEKKALLARGTGGQGEDPDSTAEETSDTEGGGETTSEEPDSAPSAEDNPPPSDFDFTPVDTDEEAIYENITPMEPLYDDVGPYMPPPAPPPPPQPGHSQWQSEEESVPLFSSEMADMGAGEKQNRNMSYCYDRSAAEPRHRAWRSSSRDSRAFNSLGITPPLQ